MSRPGKGGLGLRDNSITIKFHTVVGSAPKAYIERHRLATVRRLLAETNLRIWQVAELAGYSSLGVFSRAFHRKMGQCPKDFRRQCWDVAAPCLQRFTAEQCRDALDGVLPATDVSVLIAAILRHYPEVASQLADRCPADP